MNHPEADSQVIRTFVAVFPSREVLDSLTLLRERLGPEATNLHWVASRNLHFTLRFLGDRNGEEVNLAGEVVEAVADRWERFDLDLEGIGVFPGWKRPRVLWVGTGAGGERLTDLARELDRGFEAAGLGTSDKPFVPHLTLGRWRDARGLDLEMAQMTCADVAGIGTFSVGEIGVYQSTLTPRGARYEVMHAAPLGDPDSSSLSPESG